MEFDYNRLRVDQLERLLEVNGDFNALSADELEELLESQEEFSSFGAGLQEFYGSSVEGIGAALGIDALRDYGRREVEETQIRFNPDVPSITKAFEEGIGTGIASIPEFTLEQTLRSLPQLAFQAGAGALATRFGGPKAGAAAFTAAGVPAYTGRNIERQVEEQGISIEDADVVKAIGVGTLQSGLDVFLGRTLGVFGQQQGMKRILDSASKNIREKGLKKAKVLGPLGTAFGVGAAIEAPTEAAQQALEIMQSQPEGTDLVEYFSNLSPEIQNELLESAVAGGLVGGALQTTVTGVGTVSEARAQAKQEKEQAEAEELAGRKEELTKDLQSHLEEESQDTIAMDQLVRRFEESRLRIPVDPMYEFRAAAKAKQDASDEVFLGEDETVLQGLRRLDLERRQLNELTGPAREEKAKQLVKRQAQLERAALARAKKAEKVADRRETAEIERLIQQADNDRFLQTYKEVKRQEQELINKAVERVEKQAIKPTSDQETLEGRERTLALEQEQALREGILQNILETSSDKLEQYYSGGITKIFQTLLRAAGQPASITDREAQIIARAEGLKSPAMIDTRTPQQIQKAKDLEQKKTVDIIAEARDERPNEELDALLQSLGIDPETLNPVSQEVNNRLLEQELRSQGVTTTDPFLPPKQRRKKKPKPVPLRIKNNRLFSRAVTGADLQSLRLLDQLSRRQSNQRSKRIRDKARFPAFNQPTIRAFNDNIQQIEKNLRAELDRLGLTDVELQMREVIREQGALAEGFAEPTNQSANQKYLIALATEIYSPNLKREQLQKRIEGIMHHEVIHALRGLGVFTEAEFDTLIDAAKKTKYVDKTGTVRKFTYFDRAAAIYKKDGAEVIKEEAVAELFKDFMSGRTKLEAEKVKNAPSLFQRIITYFKGLIGGLEKSGITEIDDVFVRPEEIFEKIKTGEIGARDRRPISTESATELLNTKPNDEAGTKKLSKRMTLDEWLKRSAVKDPVYHATFTSFSAFDPQVTEDNAIHFAPEEDVGIARLEEVARFQQDKFEDEVVMFPRMIQARIQIEKPLRLPFDLGNWGDDALWRMAFDEGRFMFKQGQSLPRIKYEIDSNSDIQRAKEAIQKAREQDGVTTFNLEPDDIWMALEGAGFDGIIYTNEGEGFGSESYLVWNSQQIYVEGVEPVQYGDLEYAYTYDDPKDSMTQEEIDDVSYRPIIGIQAPIDQTAIDQGTVRERLEMFKYGVKGSTPLPSPTALQRFDRLGDPLPTIEEVQQEKSLEQMGFASPSEYIAYLDQRLDEMMEVQPDKKLSKRVSGIPSAEENVLGVDLDRTIINIYPEEYIKPNGERGFRLTGDKQYKPNSVTLLDAAKTLHRMSSETVGTKETLEYTDENAEAISDLMTTEALKALSEDNNNIGWYDAQIKAAKKILRMIEPRIFESPESETIFDWVLAVTSNGQAVSQNLKQSVDVFRFYLDNQGRLPVDEFKQGGERQTDMQAAFFFVNEYNKALADGRIDLALKDFLSSEFTVKELQQELRELNEKFGTDIRLSGDENVDTMVFGSFIGGAKIGQGFYQNIIGNYEPLTMDIWWMRMWNRLVNREPQVADKKVVRERRNKARKEILELARTDDFIRVILGIDKFTFPNTNQEYTGAFPDTGLNRTDLRNNTTFDEFVPAFNRAYQRYFSGYQRAYGQNPTGKPQIVKDMKTLEGKIYGTLQATPASGSERQYMRQVTKRTQQKLSNFGIDIEIADLQALLWYPEKRLFEALGVKKGQGQDTDYKESATELAKEKQYGDFTQEQIEEALADTRTDSITSGRGSQRTDGGLDSVIVEDSEKAQDPERRLSVRVLPETSRIIDLINSDLEGFTESIDGTPVPARGVVTAIVKEAELRLEEGRLSVTDYELDMLVRFALEASQRYQTPIYMGGWRNPADGLYYIDAVVVKDLEKALYIAESATQEAVYDLGEQNVIQTKQGIESLQRDGVYNAGRRNVAGGSQREFKKYFESFRDNRRKELITSNGRTLNQGDRGTGVRGPSGVARSNYPEYSKGLGPESGRSEFFGVHYTRQAGLLSLDTDFTGTAYAGPEKNYPRPRMFFYVQEDENLPQPEQLLSKLREGYGVRLTNIYDPTKDSFLNDISTRDGRRDFETFEQNVIEAGYDGYFAPNFDESRRGAQAICLLNKHIIPVTPVMTDLRRISDNVIDPKTKQVDPSRQYLSNTTKPKRRYSTRYSLTAGTKDVDLDELIDRLVQPKPKEQSEIMNVVGKLIGQVEGESLYQAFIRNIVNRFAPGYLLDDYLAQAQGKKFSDPAESVGRQMELSQSVTGRIWCLSQLGAVRFNKETGDAEQIEAGQTMGLDKIFEPIGSRYKREFSAYAYARRELRMRQKQGRRGFIEEDNDDLIKLVRNSEAKYPFFAQVHKNYQNFNDQMIQFAKDSGLISEEQAGNFAEMDYVPFYAYFAPPEGQSEFSKSMSAKAQAALKDPNVFEKELKGRTIPVGDLYENVTQNAAAIVTAGLKNNAMQKCANALEQSQQIVGGLKDWGRRVTPDDKGLKNVITFYQNGEKVQYVIKDAPLWNALSGLTAKQKEGFVKFGAIASNLLRSGVTLIPGFQLANLYRGKIDAFVKLGPETIDDYSFQNTFNSLKGTAKALKDTYTNDPDVSKFKLISGFGGYYYGADPETFGVNIERRYRFKEGNYDKGYKGFFRRTGDNLLAARDALERTGEASEMAERIVIMRKFMERGMSEKEAVFQGLNLINFGRRGAGGGGLGSVLVNYLIPLIPFLNARIQGLYKLAEDPNQPMTVRKAALISMYKRAGLVTLGSTVNALFQMTGDEEERWENETITEKVTNDIVYIGDYKLRIPRAFEIGSVFGAIPVMTMDAIRQKDGSDLASTFGFIFNQTFGVNLVPQAVLPIAEVAFNYDTFRKSPIEGFGVSGMPTEYRAYDSTPEFYKALSRGGLSYVGLSPLELQQLFEGYTGTFGTAFIATLDNLIGMTGVIPEKPEGAFGNAFIDIPTKISGLDRFIREDGTGASRFVNDFYETKRDIDQTYRAIKLLADGEQTEAINELMESKGAALGYRNLFNNIARSITKINKAREMIRRDPNMSSSEKKERLLALNKQRIELSRRAMKMAEDSGYFE